MVKYHRVDIGKATIVITSLELTKLLHHDQELFKEVLKRGKNFKRKEEKDSQYEKKFAESESQQLNDLLQ